MVALVLALWLRFHAHASHLHPWAFRSKLFINLFAQEPSIYAPYLADHIFGISLNIDFIGNSRIEGRSSLNVDTGSRYEGSSTRYHGVSHPREYPVTPTRQMKDLASVICPEIGPSKSPLILPAITGRKRGAEPPMFRGVLTSIPAKVLLLSNHSNAHLLNSVN